MEYEHNIYFCKNRANYGEVNIKNCLVEAIIYGYLTKIPQGVLFYILCAYKMIISPYLEVIIIIKRKLFLRHNGGQNQISIRIGLVEIEMRSNFNLQECVGNTYNLGKYIKSKNKF